MVCRVAIAGLASTLLLISTAAFAQELPPTDSNTSQYLPPVHIPPRVPLHDPGLPQSLNGKFNSTQQIRSDGMNSGQWAVIGDVDDQSEYIADSAIDNSMERREFYENGNSHGDPVTAQTRGRRRSGLQDRLSSLMARNSEQPVGTGTIRTPGQYDNAARTYSQRSIGPVVNSRGRQRRNPISGRFQANQAYQSNRPLPRQQPLMRDYRTADDEASLSASQASRFASQPIPVAGENKYSEGAGAIQIAQIAALQQSAENQSELIEQVPGTVGDIELMPDQPIRTSSARNNDSLSFNQQDDFAAVDDRAQKSDPVSVMSKPDNGLRVDSDSEVPDTVEFDAAESTSIDDFETLETDQSESLSPGGRNVLRGSNFRQESSESLRLSSPALDENQLESSFDDDDDTDDEESKNPLDKSCEEFRTELLKRPLTEISLDISPPAKTDILGENRFRVWRDRNGIELTQGTIADLRRGYVIINSGSGRVRIPYARLSDLDWLAISQFWNLPIECGLGSEQFADRCWTPQSVTWHASAVCHKPLYFENVQLERYGHSYGPFLQPVASTAHFFTRLFFLPYNTAIHPPNECQYALGFYRPGNCAPWLRDPIPISLAGAARQSSYILGISSFTW